jgi:predicted transposase YbfD/YdcC
VDVMIGLSWLINEITVVPKLLKLLNISHCTVTLDAMGCQRDIAEAIINKNHTIY